MGVGVWLGDGMGGTVVGYCSSSGKHVLQRRLEQHYVPLGCKLVGTFLYGA